MERLRGEPEIMDTTNDRGSEGTIERERGGGGRGKD